MVRSRLVSRAWAACGRSVTLALRPRCSTSSSSSLTVLHRHPTHQHLPTACLARSFSTSLPLSPREKSVLRVLQSVREPAGSSDLVFSGRIRSVHERDGYVTIVLALDESYRESKRAVTQALTPGECELDWVKSVRVSMEAQKVYTSAAPQADTKANTEDGKTRDTAARTDGLAHVKHIIAVSSCKGGVGKSTVAVNLAFALSRLQVTEPETGQTRDLRIGILDADVYGPSLPVMVSPRDASLRMSSAHRLVPPVYEGVKLMSYGFVSAAQRAPEKSATSDHPAAVAAAAGAFVRGPLASSAVRQMAADTEWGDLDYLIVDLPPGTGDIQLTLAQVVSFSGAIVVTTPQKLALVDVAKGLELFRRTRVPVLALVENMAHFTCDSCDKQHRVFGGERARGIIEQLRREYDVERIVEIPVHTPLSESSDAGDPYVLSHSSGPDTQGVRTAYQQMATIVHEQADAARPPSTTVMFDAAAGMIVMNEATATAASAGDSTEARDSRVVRVSAHALRLACRCAACVDEVTGAPKLVPSRVPPSVHPIGLMPRGNYAVAVRWSDGHQASIYTFEQIRKVADETDTAVANTPAKSRENTHRQAAQ